MSSNSTPTLYVNLAGLALEANSSALSPAVFISVPQSDTIALGPPQAYIYDVGLGGLSPSQEHDVFYNPASSPTPRIDGVPTNLIEFAEASEIRTNNLEFDIDRVLGVGGVGYRTCGLSNKFYVKSSYYALSEHESGGIFTTTSGIFVLPLNASSGVNFKFIRTGSLLNVYPSGTGQIWNNTNGYVPVEEGVRIVLDASGTCHTLSNGNNRWYLIQEKNVSIEAPFTPSGLTTALWLDASETGTIIKDGSDLVSQWNDKSGNSRHASGVLTARPLFVATGINNLGAIDFDGGDDLLAISGDGGVFSASSGEVWAVVRYDTLDFSYVWQAGGGVNRYLGGYLETPNTPPGGNRFAITQRDNDIADIVASETTAISTNTKYIVRWKSTGTVWTIDVNGVSQTLGVGGAGANTGDWFADTSSRTVLNLGFLLNGRIGELLLFEGINLTSTQAGSLYSYLSSKWGI